LGSFLSKGQAKAYLSAFVGIIVTIAIVRYPEEAFEASVYGLRLWFDVVLPALLPFFAMAEILMGLGVVHFTGVLLEPFMRPVSRSWCLRGSHGLGIGLSHRSQDHRTASTGELVRPSGG
jgi:nucleoside recognition membrane protein YjiH